MMERPAFDGSVDSGANLIVPPLVPPVLLDASYVPAACHAILIAIGHLRGNSGHLVNNMRVYIEKTHALAFWLTIARRISLLSASTFTSTRSMPSTSPIFLVSREQVLARPTHNFKPRKRHQDAAFGSAAAYAYRARPDFESAGPPGGP